MMFLSSEVRSFFVTVQPGYQYHPEYEYVNFYQQAINFPPRIVEEIIIRIPPGSSGQLGFRLEASNAPVIPCESDQWLIADDQTINFKPENTIESGSWQIIAFNNGNYPHTIFITFLLNTVEAEKRELNLINFEGSNTA